MRAVVGASGPLLTPATVVVLLAATIFPSTLLTAQVFTSVSGIVTDSAGTPIGGATVALVSSSLSARTDERGRFQLGPIRDGASKISIRRLGFSPATAELNAREIRIMMAPLPSLLSPVVVAARKIEYKGRLAGYYTRLERRSGGYFITRDEIDKKSYKNLSQLLRNIPGINAFPLLTGGSAVRMRERKCRPLVWIDGVPMPAGEVDLDAFPVSTLHGIEAYPGSSNTPQDFVANGDQGCGTIVLWSRGRDTDPVVNRGPEPVDLDNLIEAEKIFAADQVDERARLIDPDAFTVGYPPELLTQKTSGNVLVQFVVDTAGTIERETISFVTSSHPLFNAAVALVLRNAMYHPALKAGRKVRQVILQPFEFTPAGDRATQGSRQTIKQGG